MKAVLLDIEGTTTDIRFVTQTLFPYARDRMGAFLAANENQQEVQAALIQMRSELKNPSASVDEISDELVRWIDNDEKREPLKSLQGMIWKEGYTDGTLKSHIYDDVPDAFERWRASGLRLAIFSSGSVPAQKLLFGHTNFGDLTPQLSAFFDLKTGSKKEAASYLSIAKALDLEARDVRFYSDIPAEIEAATNAGCEAVLVERDGAIDTTISNRRISSFTDE